MAAINRVASGKSSLNDTVPIGTILHATSAILASDTMEKSELEEMHKKVSKLLKYLKEHKTKNSPLYSKLVEALWTTFPKIVIKID